MVLENLTNAVKDVGSTLSDAANQAVQYAAEAKDKLVQESLEARAQSSGGGGNAQAQNERAQNERGQSQNSAESSTANQSGILPKIDLAEIGAAVTNTTAQVVRAAAQGVDLLTPGGRGGDGLRNVAQVTQSEGLLAGAGTYVRGVINGDIPAGVDNVLFNAKQRSITSRERAEQLPDTGVGGVMKTLWQLDANVADLTADFTQSAYAAALQDPIDGVVQLTNMALGTELTAPQLVNRPEEAETYSARWFAQAAGTGVGIIAPIFLTGGATSAIGRAGSVAAIMERAPLAARAAGLLENSPRLAEAARYVPHMAKAALDGGLAGFLFQPANESDGLYGRVVNGVNGMLTVATAKIGSVGSLYAMSRATGTSLEALANSRAVAAIASRSSSDTMGGIMAGITSVTGASLVAGRGLPTGEELVRSIVQDTFTGALMDGSQAVRQVRGAGSPPAVTDAIPRRRLPAPPVDVSAGSAGPRIPPPPLDAPERRAGPRIPPPPLDAPERRAGPRIPPPPLDPPAPSPPRLVSGDVIPQPPQRSRQAQNTSRPLDPIPSRRVERGGVDTGNGAQSSEQSSLLARIVEAPLRFSARERLLSDRPETIRQGAGEIGPERSLADEVAPARPLADVAESARPRADETPTDRIPADQLGRAREAESGRSQPPRRPGFKAQKYEGDDGRNRVRVEIDGIAHELIESNRWYYADGFSAGGQSGLKLHVNGHPDPRELAGLSPAAAQRVIQERMMRIQSLLIHELDTNQELKDLLGPGKFKTYNPLFAAGEPNQRVPRNEGQGAKTFTLYPKDAESLEILARKVDEIIARDPQLRLDRPMETGNVDSILDGGKSNRVGWTRDMFDIAYDPARLYERTQSDADKFVETAKLDDVVNRNLVEHADLAPHVGTLFSGRKVLSADGLALIESRLGIEPGTLNYDGNGNLVIALTERQSPDHIITYAPEGATYHNGVLIHDPQTPGHLTDRPALYAIYRLAGIDPVRVLFPSGG